MNVLTLVGLILGTAGTAVSTVGGIQQAKADKQDLKIQIKSEVIQELSKDLLKETTK